MSQTAPQKPAAEEPTDGLSYTLPAATVKEFFAEVKKHYLDVAARWQAAAQDETYVTSWVTVQRMKVEADGQKQAMSAQMIANDQAKFTTQGFREMCMKKAEAFRASTALIDDQIRFLSPKDHVISLSHLASLRPDPVRLEGMGPPKLPDGFLPTPTQN